MRVETKEKSIKVLQRTVLELAEKIYSHTEDRHIKAVVNSVFDTMSVEFTLGELQGWNEGKRPNWIVEVDDEN